MRVLLVLFLGLWASVANADFMGGVLQQQAQQTPTGGGATPVVATTSNVDDTTPWTGITVTKPTGTASGDIILLGVFDGSGAGVLTFPTAPDGTWSELHAARRESNARMWSWSHTAGASEPATWAFGSASDSSKVATSAIRITGASSVEASAVANGLNTPANCPSVTTSGDNRLVLTFLVTGNFEDDVVITPNGTQIASGGGILKAEWSVDTREKATAGATGTIAHTLSGSGMTLVSWVCTTVAVAP